MPPMSMQSRLRLPVERRERRAADRAADRSGEERLNRAARRALLAVVMPPFDCITCSGRVDVAVAELALERAQIPLDARRDVRVQHGGGRTLVLAPLAGDLVRERHRQIGALALAAAPAAWSSCSGLT